MFRVNRLESFASPSSRRRSPSRKLKWLFATLITALAQNSAFAQIGNVSSVTSDASSVTLNVGSDVVKVRVLLPNVAEVDYRPGGVVSTNTLIIDPDHASKVWTPGSVTIHTASDPVTITTSAMQVRIAKNPLRVSTYTLGGQLIYKEQNAGGMSSTGLKFDGWTSNSLNWYGLQSAGSGRAWEGTSASTYWNWDFVTQLTRQGVTANGSRHPAPNMNVMPHGGQTGPFIWTLGNTTIPGFAVLWDNEGGTATLGNTLLMSKTGARGLPELNAKTNVLWFSIVGSPFQIMDAMTQITGRPSMFPKYASGFINTEWGVDENELKTSIETYRARNIPLDVYTLDFDWKHWGEHDNGEFHWNPDKFPSAASGKLKDFFEEQGNHIMAITKPRIHRNTVQGQQAFDNGWYNSQAGPGAAVALQNDYFSGKPIANLKFSLQAVREWFAQKTVDGAYATGVDGWWNDEFEETDIMDGAAGNVYNPAVQKEIFIYQRTQFSTKRVWSNNRTSYLGSHRYGYSVWSGDVFMAWNQLQVEPPRMLQVINAGLGRTSTDGGGTSGSTEAGVSDAWDNSDQNVKAAHMPVPELYARWIQFSSFMPIFRTHGANPLAQRQPWNFNKTDLGSNSGNGETGSVEAIRFRSKLIPYIYSHERKYAETGIPIVRPLNWDNPSDPNLVNYSKAWMFGDSLLVSPILKKQALETTKPIYLPPGTWYDYFRGTTYVQASGGTVSYDANDPKWISMPVFAKAGAIIPNYFHNPQYVGEGDQSQIQVEYFPSTSLTSFDYYDDDGLSYNEESNQFFKQAISGQQVGSTVNVNIATRTGITYTPALQDYIVAIQRFKASSVNVGGSSASQHASLADLRNTAGEGWATGANAQGAVTYVKIPAGVAKAIAATQSAAPVLSIVTTALPNGTVNQEYDQRLFAEGLGSTVSWSLTSGTIPAGLTFDTKVARIYGRPTAATTANLSFQLVSGGTVTRNITLTIGAAPLLVHEPFNYEAVGGGLEGAQGGVGFVDFWERKLGSTYDNPVYPTTIDFGNNQYGALPFSGNRVKLNRGSAGNRYAKVLQAPFVDDNSAKTVWLSFIGTGSGVGSGGLSLTRSAGTSNDSLLIFGKKTGSANWSYDAKVGSQSSGPSSVPVNNTPAFILVKIDVINSGTRTVRMWVNPAISGTAPSDASANIITNQGSNNLSFGRIELTFDGAPETDTLELDEIRLGTSYSDVVVLTEPALVWKQQDIAQGVTSTAYNYQIIASGSPTSFAVAGGSLPPGLSLNTSTGVLSGTPTTAGTYSATFTATNANGTGAAITLKVTIFLASAPSITAGQTATGLVGTGFSYTLQATGLPTAWSLVSGSLPLGIILNPSTGVLSGTPTGAGAYVFTVGASNAQGSANPDQSVTVTITAPLAGLAYDQIGGSIGDSPVGLGGGGGTIGWGTNSWQGINAGVKTIVAGLTYPGVPAAGNALEMDGSGYVGVKRQFGSGIQRNGQTTWMSLLTKVNRAGSNGVFIIELVNAGGTQFQVLTESAASNWKFGRSGGTVESNAPVVSGETALILVKMEMNNGSSSYRLWVNPPVGSQPSDASANGTITNASSFDFIGVQTIQLDPVTLCYLDEFRLGPTWSDVMGAAPVIAPGQNPSAMQTIPLNYQVQASPDATSWAIVSGSVPAGLNFNTSTGILSGTVTSTGTFSIGLTAANGTGTSGSQTLTISAVSLAQPTITSGQSTSGIVGDAFSYQIVADFAVSYTLSNGSLPPGVTLNSASGLLNGTPTAVGNYTPQFTVSNSAGTSVATVIPITVSQLIAYDGFNYTAGTLSARNGGTGWTAAWDGGQNETNITGMTYYSGAKTLTTAGGRVIIKQGGSYTNFRNLPAIYSTGTYWLSFIAKSNNPGNNGYGGLSLFNGSTEQIFIGQRYNGINWGVEKGAASVTSGAPTSFSTFIVVKLVLKAGADDVYMWTNPALDRTPADGSATQLIGGVDITMNRVRLEAGLTASTMDFDELRIGNSFAEVAPTTAALPQPPAITAGQSRSGTVNSPFSYTIAASNSPTSYALSSGTLPTGVSLNSSTGLLSGTPSASGSFSPSFTAINASGTSSAVSIAITITVTAAGGGGGVAIFKIMTAGDSITALDNYQGKMRTLFTNGGFTTTWVGSKGTSPNFNEGWSGKGLDHFNWPTAGGSTGMKDYMDAQFGNSPAPSGTVNVVTLLLGINNLDHGLGVPGGGATGFPDVNGDGMADGPKLSDNSGHDAWITSQVNQLVDTILNHPSNVKLVIAKIPPVGRGRDSLSANFAACVSRINRLNTTYQAKCGSLSASASVRVRLVDMNPLAEREYGNAPTYDWGTQTQQEGDWVHPRPDAGLWSDVGSTFYNAIVSFSEPTYAVSGTVTLGGSAQNGVTVSAGGSSAITDSSGGFSLNLSNGAYTLTPSLSGFSYTPATRSVTVSGVAVSGQNFAAVALPTYTITGTLTVGGSGLNGVTVSDGIRTATTTASGSYTLNNVPQGSYTITPSFAGYSFSPVNLSGTLSGNLANQNFAATFNPSTYEGFLYSAGTGALAGKNGGTNWSGAWDGGANDISATGLTYTSGGTLTAANGKGVFVNNTGSFRAVSASAMPDGTYWISFLAKSTNSGTNWGGLSLFNGASEQLFIGQRLNATNWGLERSGGENAASGVGSGTVSFIVAKVVLKAGADDVYLWVNPSLADTPSDGNATQLLAVSTFTFDRVRIQHGLGNGQTLEVDEVRLGQSYADVAPTGSGGGSLPVITPGQAAGGTTGQAFSYPVTASNSPTLWALVSGSLPTGVTFATTTGVLSGTPAAAGSFAPLFTATNGNGTSAAQSVALTIAAMPVPVITPSQSATGAINAAFNYAITAGNSPTNWALVSGSLPSGVTLNASTGILTGTPSSSGLFTPIFTAANAGGISNSVAVSIQIAPASIALAYDGFNQANATQLTGASGGSGWIANWSAQADRYRVTNPGGLAYLNLATSGGFVEKFDQPTFANGLNRSFAPQSGRVWASALINFQQLPSYFEFKFNEATNANWSAKFGINGGNLFTEHSGGGATATAAFVPQLNQTYLFVFTYDATGASPTSIFVNPNLSVSSPMNSIASAVFAGTNWGMAGGIGQISMYAANGLLKIDEVRIGNSFAEVTPVVVSTSGIVSFRASYGLAADGLQDTATPAGDGIANLLKYAFNMLGNGIGQVNNLMIPNVATILSNGNAGLPRGEVDANGKLRITYVRRKISSNSGITYTVEYSDSLAGESWSSLPLGTESISSIDNTFERVVVTDSSAGAAKRFRRLRVTCP